MKKPRDRKKKRLTKLKTPPGSGKAADPKLASAPPNDAPAQAPAPVLPGDVKSFGRPSKLTRHLFEKILLAYALGATDEQISQLFDIAPSSINLWKKNRHFSEAVSRAKEGADDKVETMLLKRALGYDFTEQTLERVKEVDQAGKEQHKLAVTKLFKKHMAPDVYAQIFWLKNRRKNKWRDKEETGPPQIATVTINNITVQAPPPSVPAPVVEIPGSKSA